jgi:hypothetical protein
MFLLRPGQSFAPNPLQLLLIGVLCAGFMCPPTVGGPLEPVPSFGSALFTVSSDDRPPVAAPRAGVARVASSQRIIPLAIEPLILLGMVGLSAIVAALCVRMFASPRMNGSTSVDHDPGFALGSRSVASHHS